MKTVVMKITNNSSLDHEIGDTSLFVNFRSNDMLETSVKFFVTDGETVTTIEEYTENGRIFLANCDIFNFLYEDSIVVIVYGEDMTLNRIFTRYSDFEVLYASR